MLNVPIQCTSSRWRAVDPRTTIPFSRIVLDLLQVDPHGGETIDQARNGKGPRQFCCSPYGNLKL